MDPASCCKTEMQRIRMENISELLSAWHEYPGDDLLAWHDFYQLPSIQELRNKWENALRQSIQTYFTATRENTRNVLTEKNVWGDNVPSLLLVPCDVITT